MIPDVETPEVTKIDPIIVEDVANLNSSSSYYSNSKKTLLPYIIDGTVPDIHKALTDFVSSPREEAETIDDVVDRIVVSDEAVPVYVLLDSGNIKDTYMNDDIDFNSNLDVTLVTQLSIDRVWLLEGLCSRWGGRVAAAIFVRSQEDLDVVSMLQELLVGTFPVRIVAVSHIESSDDLPEKADETVDSLSNYPINSMRNVAIEYVVFEHFQ